MFPLVIRSIEDDAARCFMEQIYIKYNRLLYSQICKLTHDHYEIEEIVQESLLQLIGKVDLLQTLPKDRLVNYIISTAKYTAYRFFRKEHKIELVPLDADEANAQTAYAGLDELVIKKIEGEHLYQIWSSLKERDRTILNMKYILGYSNDEIADTLGIQSGSLRMMLTRARRNLAAGLEKAAKH